MLKVPGFEVLELLYEGQASCVHRARGPDREVVLKSLDVRYPTSGQLAAYRNEYELLSRLDIEGVVEAYDLLEVGNGLVLVLECVNAPPLSDALSGGPVPVKSFLGLARQVVRTVGALHDAGVIHKDLNPSNLLYDPVSGQVRVIDFNIATELPRERPQVRSLGYMEGTLDYMSPEQTGRMNRPLDYRTDLYSLGATFYHVLTGRAPFPSDDPLVTVHSHIARMPKPPSELVALPGVLSDIVMKLLSKDAADRYQSCAGLLHDIEECDRQLRETYTVTSFELGSRDVTARFAIPDRIYGRERELKILQEGFDRVSRGETGVLVVAGYSGIGKSSLVNEVHRPLVRERGRFIEGKFDQYRRDKPYSALIEAFRNLTVQILIEGETERWKAALTSALGANLDVIAGVIPELTHIVGDLEAVPDIGAMEARNRFHFAFQRFVSVFTQAQRPLVVFIDDLQWADQASLELLKALLTDPDSRYLYLMACYRDNEAGPGHPLHELLDGVEEVHPVQRVKLPPLDEAAVRDMVTDAFGARPDEAARLTEILLDKTGGNPFYLNEFLLALNEAGLFTFDVQQGEWTWDADEIRAMGPTQNVSELMTSRLRRLPEPTQDLLRLAASVGIECREASLSTLAGVDPLALRSRIAPALREGIMNRTGGHGNVGTGYRFVHDRVRQSAYSLTPELGRAPLHLRIGRHLLEHTGPEEWEDRLFDIVDQLNAGRDGIEGGEEALRLAELNLEAGRRAKASAAFTPALQYFTMGMEALPDEPWDVAHELTAALHVERGECEFLNGDPEASETFLATAIERSVDPLEAMPAYAARIASHNARGLFVDSIGISIEALSRLGIELPTDSEAIEKAIGEELARIDDHLSRTEIEDLIDLPPMTDPLLIEALQILVFMTSTAYIGYPEIYPLIVAKQINLSIEHGNAPASPVAYSSYAVLNSPGGLGNIDTSSRFGELALAMQDRNPSAENATNIDFVFGTFVNHWRNHVAGSLTYLERARQSALDLGDFEYVKYAVTFEAFYAILSWKDLTLAQELCESRLAVLRRLGIDGSAGAFRLARQLVLALSGESDDPTLLVGPEFDEVAAHDEWLRHQDFLSLSCLAISRLILATVQGDGDALELVDRARPFLVANTGMFLLAEFHFCAALAHTAAAWSCEGDQRAKCAERARESLELLAAWAEESPENLRHRVTLIRAELAALGQEAGYASFEDIIRLYESAAHTSREHGFLLHEGLAYERAAAYCDRAGLPRFSLSFLADALYAFERLGAEPKVTALRARWDVPSKSRSKGGTWTRSLAATGGVRFAFGLDSQSFLKAGQAISAAIQMDTLLTELMRIVLESAGAERGALIQVTDGAPRVVAQRDVEDPDVRRGRTRLEEEPWIASSVVHFVLRTRKRVVLDDAVVEGPFTDDPEVQRLGARSILCMPVGYQGRISHQLYLRNDLSAGAFTEERIEALSLLSGQIAVSLANAELFEHLEEKVQQRTEELELRNTFIRQAFGRYLSDDVAEGLLENPEELSLGGEQREVTVLLADLRGFTPLTESLAPEKVVSIINNYLSVMTELIFKYHGTINDFIGDAILAIFGAPLRRDDDAERAAACAIEMQLAMDQVNQRNRKLGLPDVEMGVGLHTGLVVVGNLGSEKRAKYGVIGPAVNAAARVESYTVGGQILASEETIRRIRCEVGTNRALEVLPKGVTEPILIHELEGIGGRFDLRLAPRSDHRVSLAPELPVRFHMLDGKDATGALKPASLVAVSTRGARLRIDHPVEPLSDMRLRLSEGDDIGDIYGKVVSICEPDLVDLRFTSVPTDARERIGSLLQQSLESGVD